MFFTFSSIRWDFHLLYLILCVVILQKVCILYTKRCSFIFSSFNFLSGNSNIYDNVSVFQVKTISNIMWHQIQKIINYFSWNRKERRNIL